VLHAQSPAHLEPVDAGHEHVEDHGIGVRTPAETVQRLLTILCAVDLVPLELESPPERFAHRALVIDDQNLHLARIVRKLAVREPGS
jgi:hypothetical protein